VLTAEASDKFDPLLGWKPKPNFKGKYLNNATYTTNSQGIRGQREYSYKKDPSTFRIITIGDSFTFGENANDNETYPFLLEQTLTTLTNKTIEVINFGVHATGTDQGYLYLKEEGMNYTPNLIVYGLFIPDIHRNSMNFRDYAKPRFTLKNGDLVLESLPREPGYYLSHPAERPILYSPRLIGNFLLTTYKKLTLYHHDVELTKSIIKEMNNLTKEKNAQLIVVLIPTQASVETDTFNFYDNVQKSFKEFAPEESIPLFDLEPEFKLLTKAENITLYNEHWTLEGNKEAAEAIAHFLIQEKLLQ